MDNQSLAVHPQREITMSKEKKPNKESKKKPLLTAKEKKAAKKEKKANSGLLGH